MSDVVIYLPLVLIALVTVFLVWTLRGKSIPDWVVGAGSLIAGAAFLLLFLAADSQSGLLFGLIMIGLGSFAWYRHISGRMKRDGSTNQSEESK